MKISEIAVSLSARTLSASSDSREIGTAYAGDMLSDVLALGRGPDLLLTGLLNPQVIRTAEMLDISCVIFVRGKEPDGEILSLAEKCGVAVLSTDMDMYEACGILCAASVLPA